MVVDAACEQSRKYFGWRNGIGQDDFGNRTYFHPIHNILEIESWRSQLLPKYRAIPDCMPCHLHQPMAQRSQTLDFESDSRGPDPNFPGNLSFARRFEASWEEAFQQECFDQSGFQVQWYRNHLVWVPKVRGWGFQQGRQLVLHLSGRSAKDKKQWVSGA